MKISYRKSFTKDLKKSKETGLGKRIVATIEDVKNAGTLSEISSVKKMQGYDAYYRIRVGDYRIGLKLEEDGSVTFVRFLHRKEIYRYFP